MRTVGVVELRMMDGVEEFVVMCVALVVWHDDGGQMERVMKKQRDRKVQARDIQDREDDDGGVHR